MTLALRATDDSHLPEPVDRVAGGPKRFLVTQAIPDGTGAHKMAAQYALALRRHGYLVLFACGGMPTGEDGRAGALLNETLRARGVEIVVEPGLRRVVAPFVATRLASLIRAEHIDAVIPFSQLDGKFALWAARKAGVPCIVSAQNQYRFWGPLPLRRLKRTIYGSALRRAAHHVVCTSRTVQDQVIGEYGVPTGRTSVIPNGIDVFRSAQFPPADVEKARKALGVDPQTVLLLNVGRIDMQKGQDRLLEAYAQTIARFPDSKLVLVGAPTHGNVQRMSGYEQQLRQLVQSCNLRERVTFAGWRDDIPVLLAAADVYVHAARWEGPPLCLAVLEAMAARRPVIATDCSGWPDGFDNGVHGYIVPDGDTPALTNAIEKLLQCSSEERNRIGQAARQLAEKQYDISIISDRFVDAVVSLSEPRRTSRVGRKRDG